MQAIETKFLGPTNTRGSRVKASCEATSVTVGWDYGAGNHTAQSDVEANHDAAAIALIRKMEWWGNYVRGSRADGSGYVYVCAKHYNPSCPQAYRPPHPQAVNPIDLIRVLPSEVKP